MERNSYFRFTNKVVFSFFVHTFLILVEVISVTDIVRN